MPKLKINLHGESWMLKKFECSENDLLECHNVANKMNLSIIESLLDPFFYYNLKNPSIPSLEHLPGTKMTGLLNTPKNQIEILLNGKKIKKLNINDLIDPFILFPLYSMSLINIENNKSIGIYIEQRAIGFVCSFETTIDKFSLEDLHFGLIKHSQNLILQSIYYRNKSLNFRKKDTLLTYQNCYEILQ